MQITEPMCICTAWDVSNEDGTALEPRILEAMHLLLGSESNPRAGSVRGECPTGTILAGPLIDAALTRRLQLVPTEDPPPVAAASTMPAKLTAPAVSRPALDTSSGAPAPVSLPTAKVPTARLVALRIDRQPGKGGVRLSIDRLQSNGKVSSAEAPAKDQKGKKNPQDPKPGKGVPNGIAKPTSQPSVASASPAPAPVPATATSSASPIPMPFAPTYRATVVTASMQSALRDPRGGVGSILGGYLFHNAQVPWHAAIAP